MIISVSIGEELKKKCPGLCLGVMFAEIVNTRLSEDLWKEIDKQSEFLRSEYTTDSIKSIPIVSATRKAYKITGKDPNRYRPAGEGIMRRIVRGMDLYQINTAVDLVNLWALKYGYSIGGFDLEKVSGDVVAGIGKKDEQYNGIGRGKLNIEGMPVLRDSAGGIGTPTSDEERTAMSENTTKMMMVFNAYAGKQDLIPVMEYAAETLQTFLQSNTVYSRVVE